VTGALARQSLTESSVYSIGAHSEDGVQFAVATRQMQQFSTERHFGTLLLQVTANSQVSVRAGGELALQKSINVLTCVMPAAAFL
jgi:hypothetical protein